MGGTAVTCWTLAVLALAGGYIWILTRALAGLRAELKEERVRKAALSERLARIRRAPGLAFELAQAERVEAAFWSNLVKAGVDLPTLEAARQAALDYARWFEQGAGIAGPGRAWGQSLPKNTVDGLGATAGKNGKKY